MKRVVLLCALLLACKEDKPQPTQAPAATSDNPYTIDDDDVKVAPDFEEEALKDITPENVEAAVAKMEKELEEPRERRVDRGLVVRLRGQRVDVRALREHADRAELGRRQLDDARQTKLGDRVAEHPDRLAAAPTFARDAEGRRAREVGDDSANDRGAGLRTLDARQPEEIEHPIARVDARRDGHRDAQRFDVLLGDHDCSS
jgi:hypothetical protein